MIVKDILEHFLARADWVDRSCTVDRVIAGDPDRDIERCLVTWMPGFRALRHAAGHGIQLVICHEPLFWNHRDDRPVEELAGGHEKLDFIRDQDMVVLRNHDCWDRWPEAGIVWAWAGFLGLGGPPVCIGAEGYQHRYDISPVPLDDFAARVAGRCSVLGEPAVQVTGHSDQQVSRIGIGTGCACNIMTYLDMGCDCSVVCDDGSCYWSVIQQAEDMGHPVIRVSHGTSEEPGMETLTRYINENFPGLLAEHLPHGSTFRLVKELG